MEKSNGDENKEFAGKRNRVIKIIKGKKYTDFDTFHAAQCIAGKKVTGKANTMDEAVDLCQRWPDADLKNVEKNIGYIFKGKE